MADDLMFSAQELKIDEGLGYPKAYAKLCRDRGFGPYSHGPPFTFTPYALQPYQDSRAKELDWMFPIVDPKAKPSARPKIFVSILWKQLNHLGNAGFDPETFRIDPYGNVLYIHADSASPLAWDIDHWFPCSRGGLTVSSNLRLLQWQVCKKKHNKLEFLVPWWDLQVGISVNQFLAIFASSNSDFRHRGFYLLFSNGENEELNASQTVESHCFPQPFNESWKKSGLAPAAVVVSRKESNDALLALQSIDINRRTAARKLRPIMSKENEVPEMVTNPYQAMVVARDSLRQQEETVKKQAEIEKLDEEVVQLKQKNEEERTSIQDLELLLIKKRRRAEKCRRLAEAQSSYKGMLEKMIRDAMHQSVIYKEQVRLNQAASNALMARLESQKAMCDSSERELHKKFRHRDELEKQIRPEWEQIRKRSRTDDDALSLLQEKDENTLLCLPEVGSAHKQLRVFLEEEHKASEAEQEDGNEIEIEKKNESCEGENGKKPQKLQIEEKGIMYDIRFPVDDAELVGKEEDEESRKQRGKGNVEKWLQLLLDEGTTDQNTEIRGLDASKTEEIIRKMNAKYPQKEILNEEETPEVELEEATKEMKKEILQKEETHEVELEETTKKILKNPPYKIISVKTRELECEKGVGGSRRKSFEVKEKSEKIGKFKDIARSESARMLRRIPSSPSIILGMKKGVDCIRRKPAVKGDDEDYAANSSFIKSSYKVIKKAVKI
ncbi:protein lava lamp [Cynara cardunculus var. scolymus]|uniref:protein lava lamp n=1 Tax=Cynara cardunculus var. scolymus TaxID=59895 RepID=UPI000D6249DA|nr:protein lava lamp [Cynara cardunculus var. scolymus]